MEEVTINSLKIELTQTPTEFALENKIVNEETILLAKVKLAECYNNIICTLKNYVDMPEDYYKFISLWVIATYFHEQFNTFPYLFFNAMRGSGKTRTLKLVSSLGAKGDSSVQNNLTEAVLFRIPRGTTTCIDEVEQIGSKEKQTLRELLNSAYKKGMKVKRMRKMKVDGQETQVTDTFEPYFPIAMANIWGMDEVLGDRSITLILEKSDNPRITKKIEDFDTNPKIKEIKRTLNQISVVSAMSLSKKRYIEHWNDYLDDKYNDITTYITYITHNNTTTTENRNNVIEKLELNEFFNKIDDLGISGRNFELLFPLLLTAKEIGVEVFDEALRIGAELTTKKNEDEYIESKDVSLFEFVVNQSSLGLSFTPIKELTQKFRLFLGDFDDEDRWLNDKWMGKALKRLNLVLQKKRVASGRLVILNFAKAIEKLKMFKVGKKEDIKDEST